MANCKICNTEIPDGSKYCKDCREKKLEMANESYLDGLLDSVKDTSLATETIYKKKNKAEEELSIAKDAEAAIIPGLSEEEGFLVDPGDMEDFDQFDLEEDLKELDTEVIITDEELFGGKINPAVDSPDPVTESNMSEEEISEYPVEDEMDTDLENLLQGIDAAPADNDKNIESVEFEATPVEDNDFLDLLGQMSSEDPVTEDIMAINNLLKGMTTNDSSAENMPSDVGEVFSDALKAVSTLKDHELEDAHILPEIVNENIEKKPSFVNQKPEKKENKTKKETKAVVKKAKPIKAKPDKTLFQRLFGNVKDNKTAAEHEAEIRVAKEAANGTKVSKKKSKGTKGAALAEENADSGQDTENVQKKLTGKEKREARRKERAEKKKARQAVQVIDETPEDPGRINRLGAAVVFIFFGIVASVLIFGTDVVSYSLSIKHAEAYFNNQKYNEAYDEVSGEQIKDEDLVIYSKIRTVMYVNKQLNSYHNYYAMNDYPRALDSLLKGLDRYDKYIELATYLGIVRDMDYVRTQILAELNQVFNLSEQEAMKMLTSKDTKTYSIAVYNVVLENMTE